MLHLAAMGNILSTPRCPYSPHLHLASHIGLMSLTNTTERRCQLVSLSSASGQTNTEHQAIPVHNTKTSYNTILKKKLQSPTSGHQSAPHHSPIPSPDLSPQFPVLSPKSRSLQCLRRTAKQRTKILSSPPISYHYPLALVLRVETHCN